MSLSFVLVTLLAVLLLGALHVAFARAAPSAHLGELARDLTGGRDPWTRVLVAGALAATLFALGVVVVTWLVDDDESAAPDTRATTTAPTATTGTDTQTSPTTTATTRPPTTTSVQPPPGSVVLVRLVVEGSSGRVQRYLNRVGDEPVVRAVGPGFYRILVPGLTPETRSRAVLRVTTSGRTLAEVRKSPVSPALIVETRDRPTGTPAARDFTLVVFGARRDVREDLPPTK